MLLATSDLSIFFGRFHPLFIHLPIALVVILVLIEVISKLKWFTHIAGSVRFIAGISAIMAIFSAVAGWLLAASGEYEGAVVDQHRWTGVGLAVLCVVVFVLHCAKYRKSYHLALFASLGMLAVTSHLGGTITHGDNYLAEYAPQPIKGWLGGKDKVKKSDLAATKPTINPSDAIAVAFPTTNPTVIAANDPVVFKDIIQPILQSTCISCHKPEKSKGKLRLDTYDLAMKSGENGPNIIAGKSDESEFYKRLLLPLDDEDHMPPKGKTQPTKAQIEAIKFWIDSGASQDKTLAQLNPSADFAATMSKLAGASVVMAKGPATTNPSDVAEPAVQLKDVTAQASDLGKKLGIVIVRTSQQDQFLSVNASTSPTFDDKALSSLAPIAENILTLNLSNTKISDNGLKALALMPNIKELRLDRTSITDAGLANVCKADELTYLNLYGTKVTNAGLKSLETLRNLRSLYLWQTQVTPDAAKAMEKKLTNQERIDEINNEIAELQKQLHGAYPIISVGEAIKPVAVVDPNKPINTTCPVLGTPLVEGKFTIYEGKKIGFCCDVCKAEFEKNPKKYLAKVGIPEKK